MDSTVRTAVTRRRGINMKRGGALKRRLIGCCSKMMTGVGGVRSSAQRVDVP